MRILVSGCFGFIGCRLLHLLLENKDNEVVGFDNFYYHQEHLSLSFNHYCNFSYHNYDFRNIDNFPNIESFDCVIHLAALVGMPICELNQNLAMDVNLNSVKKLVASINKDQKLIYLTTNSGYGVKSGEGYCTEDTPLSPISVYGVSKVESEKFILDNHSNSITLRLATLFGTSLRQRFDLLVNDFCYRAFFDKEISVYEPNYNRNFVHISDVCKCLLFCVANFEELRGEPYNVGLDSANMSKLQLAQLISNHVACDVKVVSQGKDQDKRDYLVSSNKINEKGFEAKITIQEGVDELCRFFSILPIDADARNDIVKKMRNS